SVRKDLRMFPYKKKPCHILSQAIMSKRLICGRKIIQQLSQDRSPSVLLAGKKIFTVQATHSCHDWVWPGRRKTSP
ncbi:Hypothetical protein FKW44_006458, partial [Caligus rogercresseyi]